MSILRLGMVFLSLMLITCEISALKCWRCASDTSNSEFCGETLDLTQLTYQKRNWHYVECTPPKETPPLKNLFGDPISEKMVSKCRMQIQSINGQKVYSRHCVVEAENAERNACMGRNVLQPVKMLACETCQEDGCNENFSTKPAELKVEEDNNAAIKTVHSIQVLVISFIGVVARLFF